MTCHYLEPRGAAADQVLAHVPQGIAWECFRRAGKTAYRLIHALSGGYEDAWNALCRLSRELDPRTTADLIGEWERAVSLPDSCLPAAHTLDERRVWIMWRLAKRRWTTAQDWKDLAALFGLEIAITPGWYVQKPALYQSCYPVRYDLFPKLGRFRVYIDILNVDFRGYEYGGTDTKSGDGYPIPYGDDQPDVADFMCLINRVKPANVLVIWNEFPQDNMPCISGPI